MPVIEASEILFDAEAHSYRVGGKEYDSVTQVIRLAGIGDDFSMVSKEVMESAQIRGRLVHMACQFFDDGELDPQSVAEPIQGYVDAYMRFRHEIKIIPLAVEQKMVSEEMGLAGTPDLICFLNGRRSVVDRKTSQYMSKSMGLQTAGYKILWNDLRPGAPVYDRYGLKLSNDGSYKLIRHEDGDDEPAFMAALKVARAKRAMMRWEEKYAIR